MFMNTAGSRANVRTHWACHRDDIFTIRMCRRLRQRTLMHIWAMLGAMYSGGLDLDLLQVVNG